MGTARVAHGDGSIRTPPPAVPPPAQQGSVPMWHLQGGVRLPRMVLSPGCTMAAQDPQSSPRLPRHGGIQRPPQLHDSSPRPRSPQTPQVCSDPRARSGLGPPGSPRPPPSCTTAPQDPPSLEILQWPGTQQHPGTSRGCWQLTRRGESPKSWCWGGGFAGTHRTPCPPRPTGAFGAKGEATGPQAKL